MGIPPEVDGILGLCQGGELDFDAIEEMSDSDDDMEEMEEKDEEDDEEYVMGALFANGLFAGDKITQNSFSFYLADE